MRLGELLVDPVVRRRRPPRASTCVSRSAEVGGDVSTYGWISSQASSPETTSLVKSSLKTSRIDPDGQVRLAVQQLRGRAALCSCRRTTSALASMSSHCAVRRSTSARSSSSLAPSAAVRTMTPARVGDDLLEDLLEAGALGVGQLAGDAGHRAVRARRPGSGRAARSAGEPRALVADRVLGDLDQHGLARAQRVLDARGLVRLQARRRPS